jgi:hypothetical protein
MSMKKETIRERMMNSKKIEMKIVSINNKSKKIVRKMKMVNKNNSKMVSNKIRMRINRKI